MTRFDTIFWLAENLESNEAINVAFWRFYARRLLADPIVLPTLQFLLQIGRFIFLIFLDEV